MGLMLTILENGEYVVLNKTTPDSCKTPSYSLTPKGILIKRTGGFVFKKRIDWFKSFLIISASFVTIIVGIATSVDFYYNYLRDFRSNKSNQTDNKDNDSSSSPNTQSNIKISNEEHETEKTETHNNTNNNRIETIVKSDTILQSVEKSNIGTTKK